MGSRPALKDAFTPTGSKQILYINAEAQVASIMCVYVRIIHIYIYTEHKINMNIRYIYIYIHVCIYVLVDHDGQFARCPFVFLPRLS